MNKKMITIIQILCIAVFVFSAGMIIKNFVSGNINEEMFEGIKELISPLPTSELPTGTVTISPYETITTPSVTIPIETPKKTPENSPNETHIVIETSTPEITLTPVLTPEITPTPTLVPTPTPTPTPPPTPTPTPKVFDRTNTYKGVYEKNNDTIGWIKISGTKIDYPVMQRKDELNYYLKRDFYGNYSDYGVPYVMEECDIGVSDNLIIYGHHMKNGSMFSNLLYYRSKKLSYYNSHKDIQFDTFEDGDATYRIFAAIDAGDDDDILHFISAENKEAYDNFIATCKKRSLFDTGITPQYGDKIITLATCRFDWLGKINGKFLVLAVKI